LDAVKPCAISGFNTESFIFHAAPDLRTGIRLHVAAITRLVIYLDRWAPLGGHMFEASRGSSYLPARSFPMATGRAGRDACALR
jgi:hypothetical protein